MIDFNTGAETSILDTSHKKGRAIVDIGDGLYEALAEAREWAQTPFVVEFRRRRLTDPKEGVKAVFARVHAVARSRSHAVTQSRGRAVARSRGHAVTRSRSRAVTRSRSRAVARSRGHAVTQSRGRAVARSRGRAVARSRGRAVARSRSRAVTQSRLRAPQSRAARQRWPAGRRSSRRG